MTDEIVLFCILGAMLAAALAFVLPPLLREPRGSASRQDEYGRGLGEALSEQAAALREGLSAGTIGKAEYARMMDDLRRRAIEESSAAPDGGSAGRGKSVSHRAMAVLTAALMTAVSFGFYALNGAPEMMKLLSEQTVIEGTAGIEALKLYLKDNARDGRAWVLLARRYAEQNDFVSAADAYRRGRSAYAKVREDPGVMTELAAALVTIGTPEACREAVPLLKAAGVKRPDDIRITELLAMAGAGAADWATAADAVELLLKGMSPDTAEYVNYEATLRELRRRAAEQAAKP
jgi:cytochrome c-type biogenesis protein CcmH